MRTSWLLGGCLLLLSCQPVLAQSIDDIQKDIAQVKLERKLASTDLKQQKKELKTVEKSGAPETTTDDMELAIGADKKELQRADKEEAADEAKLGQIHNAERALDEDGVAQASIDAFQKDFGNISPSNWTRGNVCDEVTFKQKGVTLTAYYDETAHLVGTSSKKKFTDLPAQAQQRIKKDYKGFEVTDVLFFDRNTSFGSDDSYFVSLAKDTENDIIQVGMDGSVRFYAKR